MTSSFNSKENFMGLIKKFGVLETSIELPESVSKAEDVPATPEAEILVADCSKRDMHVFIKYLVN